MTAIRPERLGADGNSEKSGPEKYAPVRSVPEKLADVDQAAATAFEGEIGVGQFQQIDDSGRYMALREYRERSVRL